MGRETVWGHRYHLSVSWLEIQMSAPELDEFLQSPPANLKAPPPASWRTLILATVLGGVLGYLGVTALMSSEVTQQIKALQGAQVAVLALCGLLIFWLCLLVHEAGHLLGGVLGGLRPVFLFAGPLRLDFATDGTRRARWNSARATWGGLAVAVPRRSTMALGAARRMVAGGPAASWLLALLAFGLASLLQGLPALVAHLAALMSAAIGTATLLPLSSGGFASDGGQLLQMARGEPDVLRRLELAGVVGQSMAGLRPREWPAPQLQAIADQAQAPMLRTGARLMAAQSLDDAELASSPPAHSPAVQAYADFARDLHQDGLRHYPGPFRSALMLPLATFLAQRLHQPQAARAWLEAAQGGVVEPHERLHAEAALAAAEGRLEEAAALAGRALAVLGKSSDAGGQRMSRDRLLALQSVAQAAPGGGASG